MGRIEDYKGMTKDDLARMVTILKRELLQYTDVGLPNKVEIELSDVDTLKTLIICAESELLCLHQDQKTTITNIFYRVQQEARKNG